ncbi:MAG: rhodanese-like domain-containing protein [Terracidiphilus sp.]
MNYWSNILAVLGAFFVYALIKRATQIPLQKALDYLRNGALLIDVRSTAEFNSGHLPGAFNLPLNLIHNPLPRRVKDKNQVLLLYCHSGMRSGVARRKLKSMGYANTFNLGSYRRAERIANSK